MTVNEECKLVLAVDAGIKEQIATFQMAIAVEFGGSKLSVVSEDEASSSYPRPTLVLPDKRTFFTPLSAECALLGANPFDYDALAGGNYVDDVINGRPVCNIPEGLVNQIALFAAIHVAGLYEHLRGTISQECISFAVNFSKKEQVWRALSVIGDVLPSSEKLRRNFKEGIVYEYDWSIKRVPKEGERNILITSALPYVNNVPHLGNIIGALLSADVFARYCRSRGYNTVYICGTDEYGTATETKALEEGVSCAEVCAKYFRIHASVYDWFQIKTDIFGRSSSDKQTGITHEIFKNLYENGYFLEQSVEQCFCEQCSRFLADRYVEGTCPFCAFSDARGDQCDKCGKLINPIELINAKCKICKASPTVKSSRHLFLDLTKLQPACAQFVEESSQKGKWSANSAAIAKAWLTEGLKPRCMTRDLKWGTPVPVPGFEDKVFYVWFDAPIGYISITANYTDEWEKWWKNPDNVTLYQFMGKDNVPFHTVIFPSTLIGTNQPWTLLHHINTTEYLNYESGKFSKSRSTGVFGNDAQDSGIPAAMWRYYLLSNRPESNDSIFTWDDFAAKINSELLANLGNFVNRSCKFLYSKLNGVLGDVESGEAERELIGRVDSELREYIECLEGVKLRAGLKSIMSISTLGNTYLQESRLDSKLLVSDPLKCSTVVSVAVNLCYLLSCLLEPYLPSTAEDICKILNAPARTIPTSFTLDLLPGHCISTPFHLFQKLEEQFVKELRVRYSGKQ